MPTNILALYATGKTTGIVIDTGHDVTNVLPVFEGYGIQETLETQNYGGNALSNALRELYEDRNPLIKGNFDQIHNLKEQYCSVREELSSPLQSKFSDELFTLPDGQKIRLGHELVSIPEQIFNPVEGGFCTKSV
jgi:actin-related protein